MVRKQLQDEYEAELKRILGSESFRHSDSLRRLLEYLGRKTLNGSAAEVKEYTIGLEAFDKPSDYDPQLDASIRVLVGKLRHRLDDYYAKEGANSPIRIEVPKGHFELLVHARTPDPASLHEPPRMESRRWRWISLGLAVAALTFLSLAIHWRPVSSGPGKKSASPDDSWTPELQLIWQPFLEGNNPLLVSLGTPLFAKISGYFFRSPNINEWSEATTSDQLRLLQKALQGDYAVPSYPYTGVGEAKGAFLLCKLLHTRKPNLILERNSALSWDELRTNNVVFLGSPKLNPQLKDIPVKGGFLIEGGALRNQKPSPGEPNAYHDKWSDDHRLLLEDYALIYRLPGLYDHGEIMILASSSTEGTWAAAEYVTRPVYAKDLVKRVQTSVGMLPRCYQLVIRAEFKQQVPWKISYVTHRILNPPWESGQRIQ